MNLIHRDEQINLHLTIVRRPRPIVTDDHVDLFIQLRQSLNFEVFLALYYEL